VRWHVSVYAQQTVGLRGDVLVSIDTPDAVTPCNECFGLQPACVPPSCTRVNSTDNTSLEYSTAPHSTFRTSQLSTAWQDFCGDKFHVSVPSGELYACDQSMQRRVMRDYTPSHAALSVLAGTLQTACAEESVFPVELSTSAVLIGGTESVPGKCCLGFVFSNTSVFCVSVGGALSTVSDSGLHPNAFTIQSVVVYRDSLITTVSSTLNRITTTYVSNISAMCSNTSVAAKVLRVAEYGSTVAAMCYSWHRPSASLPWPPFNCSLAVCRRLRRRTSCFMRGGKRCFS
ncbi:hypothetical protein JZU54_06425, partial [bacterium]|nr:hypothetical protein [bacterium]